MFLTMFILEHLLHLLVLILLILVPLIIGPEVPVEQIDLSKFPSLTVKDREAIQVQIKKFKDNL